MLSVSCQFLFPMLDSEENTHLDTSSLVIRRTGALDPDNCHRTQQHVSYLLFVTDFSFTEKQIPVMYTSIGKLASAV